MKKSNIIKGMLFGSFLIFGVSCTDLKEEILDGFEDKEGGAVNTAAALQGAYEGLRDFQGQGQMFTMGEMSSDALVGPTRGGDWDDNGKWRQFHNHTWKPENEEIRGAWNGLSANIVKCNKVIYNNGTVSEIAEARFLRAFYYYNIVDLFGQAPHREAGSVPTDFPKVWTRTEATDFIISELEAVVSILPARVSGSPDKANKDAAHFLLAKTYLNKAVFTAASAAGPYNHSAADMTKVVSNVDAMSSLSQLSSNYWDNFSPTNNTSNELLFVSKNSLDSGDGNIQSRWRMGSHYNQKPDGWNGFATVAEYYNRFDANDARIKYSTPAIISDFGNPVGFQIGQMYKAGGIDKVLDRGGVPLVYKSTVKLLIVDKLAIESAGIRGMKYIPDAGNIEKPGNDYVLMRYSDALLMKAEAIARGGSGSVGTIMSDIAARTGTGQPASPATLDGIYAERGRELWWEGWRRNDMIRFGKFLNGRELKPAVSKDKYLLYPLPTNTLINPNFKQNPGY
jgi:starch-binding outer membrane protein, SusD/RagB family